MRSRNLDAASKEIIAGLFRRLIEDLNEGTSFDLAGWVSHEEISGLDEIEDQLASLGYLERHLEKGSRLNYQSVKAMNLIKKTFPLQHDQVRYFVEERHRDERRIGRSLEVVSQASQYLTDSPDLWIPVVLLGWWRMLINSGLPAVIDDVLEEGFSPKQWSVRAIRASPQLALRVARTLGKIESFESATERFLDLGVGPERFEGTAQVDQDDLERVVRILRWHRIEGEVTEPIVKALGFWWFILLILDTSDVIPHSNEALGQLYGTIWKTITKALGKSRSALLGELDLIGGVLDEASIPWARDILRFPEAI